jgi:hypothetical protein
MKVTFFLSEYGNIFHIWPCMYLMHFDGINLMVGWLKFSFNIKFKLKET